MIPLIGFLEDFVLQTGNILATILLCLAIGGAFILASLGVIGAVNLIFKIFSFVIKELLKIVKTQEPRKQTKEFSYVTFHDVVTAEEYTVFIVDAYDEGSADIVAEEHVRGYMAEGIVKQFNLFYNMELSHDILVHKELKKELSLVQEAAKREMLNFITQENKRNARNKI